MEGDCHGGTHSQGQAVRDGSSNSQPISKVVTCVTNEYRPGKRFDTKAANFSLNRERQSTIMYI